MGLRTDDRVIGDCTYRVTQLGAIQGQKVMVRLANVLGRAGAKGGDLAAKLAGIASSLSEEDMTFLCNAMAERTLIQGSEYKGLTKLQDVFDMHFAGRYLEMLRWLAFALEVNFGSFFRGLGARAEEALAGLDSSKSDSLSTLTGSTGGS